MKKILNFILLTIVFGVVNVHASSCSYTEQAKLNEEVSKIKIVYDEKLIKVREDEYDCQDVEGCIQVATILETSILNLSDNFYIERYDDVDMVTKMYSSYDKNDEGVVTFQHYDLTRVYNYTFKVYTSDNTSCPGEVVRVIYLTLPRYNDLYDDNICDQLPDHYLCQKYVTFEVEDDEDYDYEEYYSILEKSLQEKEEKENAKTNLFDNIFSFIDKNRVVIAICLGVLAVGGTTAYIVIKIRRKRSVL